jgi:uncharacterized protein YceK
MGNCHTEPQFESSKTCLGVSHANPDSDCFPQLFPCSTCICSRACSDFGVSDKYAPDQPITPCDRAGCEGICFPIEMSIAIVYDTIFLPCHMFLFCTRKSVEEKYTPQQLNEVHA